MEKIAEKNYVITIARGFGSGGKAIGLALAETLDIPCYDKEILEMAAEKSGINESYFFESDEKVKSTFTSMFGKKVQAGKFKDYTFTPENKKFTSDENLFNFQASVMRHIGNTQSCVIIGRASDYILKSYPNVLSVNIQAPLENCVHEAMNRMQIDFSDAVQIVQKSDKYRADYYYYYTGEKWNNTINYDLSLNTGRLSRELCIDIIISTAEKKFGITLPKR